MKAIVPVFVAVTFGLLSIAAPSAARAGQARGTLRVLTPEVPKPLTGTIICRGGPALVWEKPREIEDLSKAPSMAKRQVVGLIFQISRGPAGPQGLGLKQPSECGFVDKPWPTEYAPPLVYFDAASATFDVRSRASGVYSRRSSIQEYLTDINHFWSFEVVLKSFYFDAETHQRFDTKSSSALQVPILTEAGNTPGSARAKATSKDASAAQPASGNASAAREPATAVAAAAASTAAASTTVAPTAAEPIRQMQPAHQMQPAQPTAASASVPANLYNTDDRAIIIVGGKKMTAAQAKREIRRELQRSTGPVRTVTAKRNAPAELSNAGTPLINAPGQYSATTQPIGGRLPGAERAAALKMDCTNNPPRISNIQGAITPGGKFTINGTCFGTQTGGYIEIIGQFAGGSLKRQSVDWQDHAIVVEMPLLTDIPGHTVAISVRRGVDAKQSTAKQAQFVAARHRVEVPVELWSPSGRFSPDLPVERAYGDVLRHTSFNENYVEQRTTNFQVRVNPACALETLDVPATMGRVLTINGWENGPANEGNVRVVWSPACKIHTVDYKVRAEHAKFCSVAFELKARASCPAGVNLTP